MPRTILLSPGPVALTEGVKSALLVDQLGHREPEFAALTRLVNTQLCGVYDETRQDYESVVLTGSGTCAVEAMLATFAPRTSQTLVLANGVYGERSAAMLECHGLPHELVAFEWTSGIDSDVVATRLRDSTEIGAVFAVHHETTTGRLNDIAALGELCRRHGKPLMLDVVSSFGAEEIRPRSWNVSAFAGTAGKCLHGAPGISFVVAARAQWETATRKPSSVYLNLARYRHDQGLSGYSPFTQAVPLLSALHEALHELERSGGWAARRQLFRSRGTKIYKALERAGVVPLVDPAQSSCVLQSFRIPSGVSYQALHDQLKAQGFVIYAGQGRFAPEIFRIANMGDMAATDIDNLCQRLIEFFRRAES